VLSTLAHRKLKTHKGVRNHASFEDQELAFSEEVLTLGYKRLLDGCIITNVAAASAQLSGAIIYSGFILAGKHIRAKSRQSTLLVCCISSPLANTNFN
jgi:hypothetical protein